MSDRASKVLIISQRERPDGYARKPGYVAFTEAEDVLATSTDADVVMIDTDPTGLGAKAWRLSGGVARRLAGSPNSLPGAPLVSPRTVRPTKLREHYDLAVFVGFAFWDLPLLEGVPRLRSIADRVVVWVPEVWATEFEDARLQYQPYGLADHIFVGMKATAQLMGSFAPCPVHHLPPAVDVTRFAAPPHTPRPIDVLGIGRRDPELHDGLVAWSRRTMALYMYDTLSAATTIDPVEHREYLGELYRRTSLAITHHAKFDAPDVIGDQRETPGRLWEGLAGGAVMVGYPPDETLQRELIGQPVVIPLPADRRRAADLIGDLAGANHEARRRRQVQLALRGHDWVHRWIRIFTLAGMEIPDGLARRAGQLAVLADRLEPSVASPGSSAPIPALTTANGSTDLRGNRPGSGANGAAPNGGGTARGPLTATARSRAVD